MANLVNPLLYGLSQAVRTSWFWGHYALAARLAPPLEGAPKDARLPLWRAIMDDLQDLFRRDLANIRAGLYQAPHDMMPRPVRGLRKSAAFFRDLAEVNRRRIGRINDEIFREPYRGRYPRYYLQNFHFQSGGYLSGDSARLYDYQVEVLFTGGADAMRRQALVPLAEHFRTRRIREARLLDVACGTGRFLTFVKDNYPRLAVTGLDLSPHYLAEAARQLRPWSRSGLAQGNAEALPFPDAAFDIVSCIFLFHELPNRVRRRVTAEIVRVLRPGGRLVFVDSIQYGDRPDYDGLLDRFPFGFHEPYFADYARDDLTALFQDAGLTVMSVERAFFSRVMVLGKPCPADSCFDKLGMRSP